MGRSSRYIPVRAIKVSLWDRTVGAIVPYSAGYCAFEYDAGFLKSGLEIAPLKMPLANGAGPYVFNDFGQGVFMGLPGVFADSLPDGFGNTLINEYLRRQGIGADSITALDRLAYIGARGMGALCYEPERNPHWSKPLAMNMRLKKAREEMVRWLRILLNQVQARKYVLYIDGREDDETSSLEKQAGLFLLEVLRRV